MRNEINFQERLLGAVRQQGQSVTVFLTNGFQLRGVIRGYDNFTVILDSEGKQQMIYKHAISTIVPQRRVDLFSTFNNPTNGAEVSNGANGTKPATAAPAPEDT